MYLYIYIYIYMACTVYMVCMACAYTKHGMYGVCSMHGMVCMAAFGCIWEHFGAFGSIWGRSVAHAAKSHMVWYGMHKVCIMALK